MVGDPAPRYADDRSEFRDGALSAKQDLQHAKPCRIPENPEIPCAGRRGRIQRRGDAALLDRSHNLILTGFPVIVKGAEQTPWAEKSSRIFTDF